MGVSAVHAERPGFATMDFKIASDYEPRGDQPQAISNLVRGLTDGDRHQVLLGVTGSGKTFTMANIVSNSKTNLSTKPQQNARRPIVR